MTLLERIERTARVLARATASNPPELRLTHTQAMQRAAQALARDDCNQGSN